MHITSPRASRTRASATLAALTTLFLAACSGSGGGSAPPPPPPPSNSALVYGIAATGKAIDGVVVVEDATGRTVTLPVAGGSGAFSVAVDGMTAPFMLKVTRNATSEVLYSAIPQPGRANITPLTSLALMRIAAARGLKSPADLFAAPASFTAWDTSGNLATASATMLSRLMPAFTAQLPGAPSTPQTAPTYDPFGTAWTVGAGVDQLLDAYPVTFTTDSTGIVTALQTDQASGLSVDVVRSDTAAQVATGLSITGAGQGVIIGGSPAQFGAQAQFASGAQQAVSASWSVTGLAGASVDSNGKATVPAVDNAATITLTARWFDGVQASVATLDMTVLPIMRPTSLEITGASPNASVAAGASLALGAKVLWSDGTTTTPVATWSFTGDAAAVLQLGSDGLLRAGKPTSDSPIVVTATFSQGGVPVSAQLPLTVAHFVRLVQSVSLTGLVPGQVLTAGDHADLTLTALWNDGTESTIAPTWGSTPAQGTTSHIVTPISAAGRLTTSSYYVPTTADDTARAPEPFVLEALYVKGDGTFGVLDVPYFVKPLINIPVSIEIRGVTAMNERDSATFMVWATYADGSTAETDGTVTSQDPALLSPTDTNQGTYDFFMAAPYASKPSAPLVATLAATRTYDYEDIDGQPASVTLSTTHAVEVDWVEPTLVSMSVAVDHLTTGTLTPVPVTGAYAKFGAPSFAPLMGTTFSVDSALVSVEGNSLTATQAPATPDASWVTLTVTGPGGVTSKHVVTVDLAGNVPARLLSMPWTPLDQEVQFRAIASNGHVDDYTVTRIAPYMLGDDSPAVRRPMRLFSGATDFAASAMNPDLALNETQETQYAAAVEAGRVVIIRHDDLTIADRTALPIVLPGVTNAVSAAFVARRDDGTGTTAAVRLYVLDQLGTVRQYKLPYTAAQPLVAADLLFERQLAGTYAQISGGADFILLRSTDGGAFSEGAGESHALGDPSGASHWNDTFAAEFVDCNTTSCWSTPFTRVTQVHAGVNRSYVARSDHVAYWGDNDSSEWIVPSLTQGPDIGVSNLAGYAWIQSDGSVYYVNLEFTDYDSTPHDVAVTGQGRLQESASWLPAARQITDGRRPAAANWMDANTGIKEYQFSATLPIVRTTSDALYYLNGRPILDSLGQQIVLP